jgi:hypothetical protein
MRLVFRLLESFRVVDHSRGLLAAAFEDAPTLIRKAAADDRKRLNRSRKSETLSDTN